MDLSRIDNISLVDMSQNLCKKRRMELPLKKRYQREESNVFSALSIGIRSNGSPIESDDSALPKTPCSAQSSSSSLIDVDDCGFALDFTLPTRSRAKLRSIQDGSKKDHSDQDGIDHGFESCSTSSVTSVQEEPLDLTEKPPSIPSSLNELRRRSRQLESTLSLLPMSIFGSNFGLPFPMTPIDSTPSTPLYPNFFTQSIPNSPMASSIGQASTSTKRSKNISMNKSTKKIDNFSTSPITNGKNLDTIDLDQYNESDEDALLNKLRRNYKNMTVERRMEANARERTRVHTIGAAFDRLRKLIPSSTSDQKLSKLSILRISCQYIMLLASMNGMDYSLEQRGYTVEECIDMLTDTINVESKFKRVP